MGLDESISLTVVGRESISLTVVTAARPHLRVGGLSPEVQSGLVADVGVHSFFVLARSCVQKDRAGTHIVCGCDKGPPGPRR